MPINSAGLILSVQKTTDILAHYPLTLLPKHIIEQAQLMPIKRRQEFLAGRLLLAALLNRRNNIEVLPELILSENSRPSFKDNALGDFNISHSGDFIAVALSDDSIGLDIEIMRPKRNLKKLANYAFSQQENDWLNQQTETTQEDYFWQLWTMRESILKLEGKGVWQMKQITIDLAHAQITSDFSASMSILCGNFGSCMLSVCQHKPIEKLLIHSSSLLAPFALRFSNHQQQSIIIE